MHNKFKALSDPNRLKIIEFLSDGCKCVCKIEEALGLSQNLVSHHLKVLKDARLVDVCNCGKYRHYSLNHEAISNLKNYVSIYC